MGMNAGSVLLKQVSLCALAALGLLFAASALAQQPATVRLAQNLSPISGVAIVAKQRGFFDKHGLDVAVSNFTTGRQALEAVMAGGADISTVAEAPITAGAMAKQRMALLARINFSDVKTLTDNSDRIAKPSDLKGKRIGYAAGTGSEVYTMTLLKQGGLTPADVTLVNLRPQDMVSAIVKGSIDAMNIWEPHISNARKLLGEKARELDTKGVYAETFNIVTTQDYLSKNPAPVQRFLRALIDAHQWIRANPDQAITLIAETVGMKRDDFAPLWGDYNYDVVLDEQVFAVLRSHAQWRLDTKNAPSGATMPDFRTVVFPEPLRSIAPDRVRIK
jgi:ABC-type nitrate/sulfonate/bicarbonate transport system substrate-binding protein